VISSCSCSGSSYVSGATVREADRVDVFDAFIVNLHRMLGHDVTARYLDVPVGDKSKCRLCHPELGPFPPERHLDVVEVVEEGS
jgi:hypothetical protein